MECQLPADRGGPLFVRSRKHHPELAGDAYVGGAAVGYRTSPACTPHGERVHVYEDDGVSLRSIATGQVCADAIICCRARDQVEWESRPGWRLRGDAGRASLRRVGSTPRARRVRMDQRQRCANGAMTRMRRAVSRCCGGSEDPDRRRSALVRCSLVRNAVAMRAERCASSV